MGLMEPGYLNLTTETVNLSNALLTLKINKPWEKETQGRKDQTYRRNQKSQQRKHRKEMHQNPKSLVVKGVLGSFASTFALAGYLAYYLYLSMYGIKLNELYFIMTCIPIAIFTGILFTFFKNRTAKTLLLYTSVYYSLLTIMYVGSWVFMGQPYGYIEFSLIIGLIIGLIYWIYDYLTNTHN